MTGGNRSQKIHTIILFQKRKKRAAKTGDNN